MNECDLMLTIGQVAQMAGTTVRAVRHYHQTGLLPEPPRGPNGYRRYRSGDLNRLLQIRQLGELGLPLADVRRLVSGSVDDRREALRTLHDQYAEEERVLARRRATIAELLAVEGDPAVPIPLRGFVNGLRANDPPPHIAAADADLFRILSGQVPAADRQVVDDAVTAMADDPALVAAIAGYMRRLDEVAPLPPDHPDVTALIGEWVAFLRRALPATALEIGDGPALSPDVAWLVGDLLSERLTAAQGRVIRDTMERLATPDPEPAAEDASASSPGD